MMATPRDDRRLVAILVLDVVGYSRLMERDESGTIRRIKAYRNEILEPLLADYSGRLVKMMGDGALCEFGSAVDAVRYGLALQDRIVKRESEIAEEDRIWLRIGVNLGDVIQDDDGDIYGDGVNVAARLEQLSDPGGLAVSGTAYDHLQGRVDCQLDYAGEQSLKNITKPVRVYLVRDQTGTAPAVSANIPEKPTVAILPFENMNADPDQAYFADGITEDIITELSRFRELLVIARNSSFAFRGRSVDTREIGRVLNAGYIVEGSIRRAGTRVRITAQLIDTKTGTHIWADRYDRPVEDIFAVQDEIARAVVTTVATRVLDEGELVSRRRPTRSIRAYDLFLQGWRLSDNFSTEAQKQVHDLYERARTLDPTFARAYTGLAFYYLNRALFGRGVPRIDDPDRVKALEFAEQALALDPNDARVHYTIGYMSLVWRDFDRAARHLDLAHSMNPNDATIQIVWAWATACLGDAERAIPAAELAMRLNPRRPRFYDSYFSRILFLARQHDEALTIFERLTAEAPLLHPRDTGWRAATLAHLGRQGEAQEWGRLFIDAAKRSWRGDSDARPSDYIDWLVDTSYLRRSEDAEHLREGLRIAGVADESSKTISFAPTSLNQERGGNEAKV